MSHSASHDRETSRHEHPTMPPSAGMPPASHLLTALGQARMAGATRADVEWIINALSEVA